MTMKNRDVVVLGLGLTGLSAARWAARQGARVRVADTRAEPPFAAKLAAELPHVPLSRGPITDATLSDAAMIVISPGLSQNQPARAAALERRDQLGSQHEL
jgi:UDP-N-acetylmuramoylalanine--D-glutamate ligase